MSKINILKVASTCIVLIVCLVGIFTKTTISGQWYDVESPRRVLATNCHWNYVKSSTICDNSDKIDTTKENGVLSDTPAKKREVAKQSTAKPSKETSKPWMKARGKSSALNLGPSIDCHTEPLKENVPGAGKSGLKNGFAANVILLIVDDLQPDAVSSFKVRPRPSSERLAYQFLNTPNLDRLANGGALFARAYTAHPLCSPSRYSIMTGRYASRSRRAIDMSIHRSRDGNPPISHLTLNGNAWVVKDTITVAHAFKAAGFKTAQTGKWHLSTSAESGTKKSFTYDEASKSPLPYEREKAEVKYAGFDDVFALYPVNMRDTGFDWFSHNPEWMTVSSFNWWDRTEGNKFLYFAFTLPHMPFSGDALQKPVERIPDVTQGLQPEELSRMSAMRDRSRKHVMRGRSVAAHNSMGAKWENAGDRLNNVPGLLWIDSIVGEFMQYLEGRRELNSTLMIFGADHGNIAKGHCFEPAMRVPLIVHCPLIIKPHTVVDAIVGNIDIAATMLDAVGVGDEFMRYNERVIDGRSMLPLVAPRHVAYLPKKEIHDHGIFCEIYSDRSLVSKNYTLIDLSRTTSKEPPYQREPWGDRIQLYRSNDVEQKVNLVTKAMRQEDAVAAHHLSKLTSILASHVKDTVPKCQMKFYPDAFPTVLTNTFTSSQ